MYHPVVDDTLLRSHSFIHWTFQSLKYLIEQIYCPADSSAAKYTEKWATNGRDGCMECLQYLAAAGF